MFVLLHFRRDYFLQTKLRSMFYSPCLAVFRSPGHFCRARICVIYHMIMIQSNLNKLFQLFPAVFDKVSGIFSHSWHYQILDPTEITYTTSLLFLLSPSGPSKLILKMQSEIHIWTASHVRRAPLCPPEMTAQVLDPKDKAQAGLSMEMPVLLTFLLLSAGSACSS